MLQISNLTKTYENKPLLRGVSLTVAPGETVCLLGASGSGKSTILRIVAGLEYPESGDVAWDGHSLAGIPAYQRRFGLMFQDYALFPHLDVFENVAFGLRMQQPAFAGFVSVARRFISSGPGRDAGIARRVSECLELAHLAGFERRRVAELSGGEQQRVALARALAPGPRLLMLDEPLGALDRALKESLLPELRQILRQTGIPAIYVTHDQEEAFALADRLALLREGRLVQAGSPPEVFARPADGWVASFLGLGNVVRAESAPGLLPRLGQNIPPTAMLLLRPQAERTSDAPDVSGVVADVVFRGEGFRVTLENGWFFWLAEAPRVGERLNLHVLAVEVLPCA